MAITEKTPTTIAFLLLVTGGMLGGVLWLNNRFDSLRTGGDLANAQMKDSLNAVREEIREVKFDVKSIDAKVTDRITFSDVEAAFLKLARDNPTLKVPELKR